MDKSLKGENHSTNLDKGAPLLSKTCFVSNKEWTTKVVAVKLFEYDKVFSEGSDFA